MSKKKIAIIVIGGILLIVAVVIGVLFVQTYQKNQSIKEVIRFVENDQVDQAVNLVNNELGKQNQDTVKKQLKEYVETMQKDFLDGTLEYTIAESRIQAIEKMDIFAEDDFKDIHEVMKKINDSNVSFISGQEFIDDKKYANAIRELKNVIKEDKNYDAAQSMIEAAITSYRNETIKEVTELFDEKNYKDAFSLLEEGLDILENDTDFASLMTKYKNEYVTEQISQVRELEEQKKYQEAIKQLQEAQKFIESEDFSKKIEDLNNAYVQDGINEAQRLVETAKFEDALAYLNTVKNTISNDALKAKITDVKNQYEAWTLDRGKDLAEENRYEEAVELLTENNKTLISQKIDEAILEYQQNEKALFFGRKIIDEQGVKAIEEMVEDSFGETYKKVYQFYGASKNNDAFALYNINGGYTRFQATITPSDNMDSSSIVYFEFYGGSDAESLKLLKKTEEMKKTSNAISVDIDVTGCKVFQVKQIWLDGSTSNYCYLVNCYLQ